MKIKIQTPNDTLSLKDGKVVAFVEGQEYVFELGQAIELDYQQIIDAAMCKDNHVFVIYRRVTSV